MQNNVDFRTKYQLALNDQERYDLFDRLAYNYLKSNPADYPKIVGIYEYMKKLDSKKINALEDKIVSTEDEFLHQKTKRLSNNRNDIGSYIKKLKDFRGTVKEKLKFLAIRCAGKVEDDHLITRYGEIRKLYGTINDFFIGKDGLVKSLISQCINELGVLPKIKCQPVKYAVFGLGSMALGTMTPWSDLEFGILIQDGLRKNDKKKVIQFFRNLTTLLHIKIVRFGESPLRMLGIKELNDFTITDTSDPQHNWFRDCLTKSGFSFDGPHSHACKTPLGRKGYKGHKNFELIGTPKEIWNFQDMMDWYLDDKHLVQALLKPILITGDADLFKEYNDNLKKFCLGGVSLSTYELLFDDLYKYQVPNYASTDDGISLDPKKDVYRYLDRILCAMQELFQIDMGDKRGLWNIIDALAREEILNKENAEYLSIALSICTEIRLTGCIHNNSQEGKLVFAKVGQDTTNFEFDTELFCKYHQIIYCFQKALIGLKEKFDNIEDVITNLFKEFLSNKNISHEVAYDRVNVEKNSRIISELEKVKIVFKQQFYNTKLYEESPGIKASIYKMLLNYDKAKEIIISSDKLTNKEIVLFVELCHKTGDMNAAVNLFISREELKNSNDPEVIAVYALALEKACKYEVAESQYIKARELFDKNLISLKENTVEKRGLTNEESCLNCMLEIARINCNLGVLYCRIYRHHNTDKSIIEKAKISFGLSLDLFQQIKSIRVQVQREILEVKRNLIGFLVLCREFDKAISIGQEVLKEQRVVFGFSKHPCIAFTLNNLASAYLDRYQNADQNADDIESAKRLLTECLEIKKEFYTDPYNIKLASTYINLAFCYEKLGNEQELMFYTVKLLEMIAQNKVADQKCLEFFTLFGNYFIGHQEEFSDDIQELSSEEQFTEDPDSVLMYPYTFISEEHKNKICCLKGNVIENLGDFDKYNINIPCLIVEDLHFVPILPKKNGMLLFSSVDKNEGINKSPAPISSSPLGGGERSSKQVLEATNDRGSYCGLKPGFLG